MLLHEHLNYFDLASLRRTVEASGFEIVALEQAHHGGVLFCAAIRGTVAAPMCESSRSKIEDFAMRAKGASTRFAMFSQQVESELGIYVPLRAIPYLATLDRPTQLRFFDDDPGCHRRYLAGYDVPIENLADLAVRPVSHLMIASLAFGENIKRKVRERLGNSLSILMLRELLDESALPV